MVVFLAACALEAAQLEAAPAQLEAAPANATVPTVAAVASAPSALLLSVVVPLVRPAVYAEHLLGALDRALAAEEEAPPFESEVLLSPVDASAQPTYALPNHSRFELRLLHDEPRPRRAFVTSGEHSCGAPPRFEAVFDALGGAAAAFAVGK